jgi:hypothetical protein
VDKFEWNDERLVKQVEEYLYDRMVKAAIFLEKHVKQVLSRGNRDGTSPSRPGEPPKLVTGALRSSIGHRVTREKGEVRGFVGVRKGPAAIYGARWEFTNRPYLAPTLERYRGAIIQILTG